MAIQTSKFFETHFFVNNILKPTIFRIVKKNNKKGKGGGQPAAPGGFTEPNFGKVKQKSTMAKGGTTHGSFTHNK